MAVPWIFDKRVWRVQNDTLAEDIMMQNVPTLIDILAGKPGSGPDSPTIR